MLIFIQAVLNYFNWLRNFENIFCGKCRIFWQISKDEILHIQKYFVDPFDPENSEDIDWLLLQVLDRICLEKIIIINLLHSMQCLNHLRNKGVRTQQCWKCVEHPKNVNHFRWCEFIQILKLNELIFLCREWMFICFPDRYSIIRYSKNKTHK